MGKAIKYSNGDLMTKLQEKAIALGRPPTMAEVIADENMPHSTVYCRRFGSWRAALERAGLEFARKTQPQMYSNRELIELLQGLAVKIGRTPTIDDVRREKDIPCPETY